MGSAVERLVRAAGVATALVATVAACNSLPGQGAGRSPSSHAAPSGTRTSSAEPSSNGELRHATFSVSTVDDQKEVYRVAVTALYRSGPFTRLGITVHCEKASTQECVASSGFGGGTFNTYGGLSLIDPDRHTQYLPVKDSNSQPFTSLAGHIPRGKTEQGWVVFPAVAKDSRQLDVLWPTGSGPVMQDVPVGDPRPQTQRAPAADFDRPKDTNDSAGLELPVHQLALHTTSEGADEKQTKDRKDVTLNSDVLFDFDKADLTGKAKTVLDRIAAEMERDATGTVDVTGYTDAKGPPKVNKPLSRKRARAVSGYLKSHVDRDLPYSVSGKGEANPVAPNTHPDGSDNPKGRAKNRRVTVSYEVARHPSNPTPSPTRSQQQSATPQPVTWQTTGVGTDTYRVTAHEVRRHGDLAILRFTMTCVKSTTDDNKCWQLYELGKTSNNRIGGVTLYQEKTKTRRYPATDTTEDDEVSTSIPDTVDVGTTHDYWVYFSAPTPGVQSIDVKMPHDQATIHDVPVR